uniref:Uncharacterized protein n=1 Tax=Kalanchoe fedtschenkoi TaxID=63787 RepID=A0A7N0T8V0_KALFE
MIRFGRAAVCPCLAPTPYGPLSCAGVPNNKVNATTRNAKALGITAATATPSPAFDRMPGGRVLEERGDIKRWNKKKRVFFLDVNPLCYAGSKPSLRSFAHWISLFFSQVSHDDPVIAVLDGERGNEHRRKLLPSYKAHRRGVSRRVYTPRSSQMVPVEKIVGRQYAQDALTKHADHLRRNYEVLALKRNLEVHVQTNWLYQRDTRNDSVVISTFLEGLGETQ